MPKLKQRKDGGYYTLKRVDDSSISTFQTTDEGAAIVKSSGRTIGESYPDELFYLIYDLGHLSTGDGGTPTELSDIINIEWAIDNLSVEECVNIAIQIIDEHGVEQLLEGDAAKWVSTLIGKPPVLVKPLNTRIAERSGYSLETVREYAELMNCEPLEAALCAHLQMNSLWETEFDDDYSEEKTRNLLGVDEEYAYIETTDKDTRKFAIVGELPDRIPDELREQLDGPWNAGIGAAGLGALASIEVQHRYDVENGLVIPRERLEEFPIELPPRSELTELYEAFRLLRSNIDRVLSSESAGVEHGDGSHCDIWYQHVDDLLNNGRSGVDSLGSQQSERVDATAQEYRECYGNGDEVTNFACIQTAHPGESEQLRLFGFGIFDHSESVKVPVSPESEEQLPVYPQNKRELDRAVQLLEEFPSEPAVGEPI